MAAILKGRLLTSTVLFGKRAFVSPRLYEVRAPGSPSPPVTTPTPLPQPPTPQPPPPTDAVTYPTLLVSLSRASAPAVNPPEFFFDLPSSSKVGDTIRLQRSQSETFASGIVASSLAVTDDMLNNGVAPGFAIPVLNMDAPWFFRVRLERSGGNGPWSNTIGWNDATALTISTPGTASVDELAQLAIALAANKTVARWEIIDSVDQVHFEVSGTTLRWFANGFQRTASPEDAGFNNVYEVTLRATDLFGLEDTKSFSVTVVPLDLTPAGFGFPNDLASADRNTQYFSGKITLTDMVAGIDQTVTPTGTAGMEYQRTRGGTAGAWTAVGTPVALRRDDEFEFRFTTGSGYSVGASATLSIGGVSDTWNVLTLADPAAPAQWAITNGVNKDSAATVSGSPFKNVLQFAWSSTNGARALPASTTGDDIEYRGVLTGLVTDNNAHIYIGVDDGSRDINGSNVSFNPADTAKTAFINIRGANTAGTNLYGNAYNLLQGNASGSPTSWVNGDEVIVRVKKSTGVVRFFHKRGQVETQIGTNYTLTGMTNWYAVAYGSIPATFTADFTSWGAVA